MKALTTIVMTALLASSLTGCLVRTQGHNHGQSSTARRGDCGPAHHWEGGSCVHNGQARGHRK